MKHLYQAAAAADIERHMPQTVWHLMLMSQAMQQLPPLQRGASGACWPCCWQRLTNAIWYLATSHWQEFVHNPALVMLSQKHPTKLGPIIAATRNLRARACRKLAIARVLRRFLTSLAASGFLQSCASANTNGSPMRSLMGSVIACRGDEQAS